MGRRLTGTKPKPATLRQRRWRKHVKQLETGADKRERRDARLAGMAERTERAREQLAATAPIYNVLLVDPGTRFEPWSRVTGLDRAADNHYWTESLDAIKELRIPAAPDSVIFMWSTVPLLPQMLEIMTAWGFVYVSHLIWAKTTLDGKKLRFGTGYQTRNAHELLLIGKRGEVPAPIPGEQPPSVIHAPRTRHSEKPAVFAEWIERLYPDVPKLEMFARTARAGWDRWGNEAPAEFVAAPGGGHPAARTRGVSGA